MEALVAGPTILCARCHALERGVADIERHHIAGRANLPLTLPFDVNDHRLLTDMQRRWPKRTLRNPDRDDRLRACGLLRGVSDVLALIAQTVEDSV